MVKLETIPDTVKEVMKDRKIPLNKIKELFGSNFQKFFKGNYVMNNSELKKLAALTGIDFSFWKNLQDNDLKDSKYFPY